MAEIEGPASASSVGRFEGILGGVGRSEVFTRESPASFVSICPSISRTRRKPRSDRTAFHLETRLRLEPQPNSGHLITLPKVRKLPSHDVIASNARRDECRSSCDAYNSKAVKVTCGVLASTITLSHPTSCHTPQSPQRTVRLDAVHDRGSSADMVRDQLLPSRNSLNLPRISSKDTSRARPSSPVCQMSTTRYARIVPRQTFRLTAIPFRSLP